MVGHRIMGISLLFTGDIAGRNGNHSINRRRCHAGGARSARCLVALAAAFRNRVALAGLAILEAPAVQVLREEEDDQHYRRIPSNDTVVFR